MVASDSAQVPRRVYLDHAATTWPKSAAATAAAVDFLENCGATAGRGVYASAGQAESWLKRARRSVAELIGAPQPLDIAFCNSGTHALNAALNGLLQPGDHVLTTGLEHNSVLRPLKHLERERRLAFDVVPTDASGTCHPSQARAFARSDTRWLVVGHASNVTGRTQNLVEWAAFAREIGARLLVDASQTLGYLPVDMADWGIDALAAAGHKGLRAWSGTGFLAIAKDLQAEFAPWMWGGTGVASESIDDVPSWPQSVEAGNLNIPAVISMAVAAEDLLAEPDLTAGWLPAFRHLVDGLRGMPGIRLLGGHNSANDVGPTQPKDFVPVVSLLVEGWDVHELAAVLDASFQIEVRAGWHCAALIHPSIGSGSSHGTLRLSTGRSTSQASIDYTLEAFRAILAG